MSDDPVLILRATQLLPDDAILMLRVTQLTTTNADLEEKTGVFVQLSGRVVSPIETILALVRAQQRGQPIVALALVDDRKEPVRGDPDVR